MISQIKVDGHKLVFEDCKFIYVKENRRLILYYLCVKFNVPLIRSLAWDTLIKEQIAESKGMKIESNKIESYTVLDSNVSIK